MIEPKLRFKADDGRQFPDWEEKKIGELGTFTKGAPLSKADISECGSPLILYGELYTTYKEVAYNIQRKTQAVVDEKYYSCVGDVIIPTSGESAEDISTATCVMTPGVVLGGDLNIFRSNILDGRIVSYILNHQAKWKIAAIAQGKSIVHIQAKQLSNIHVKYPVSKAEQQKIAEFLSTIDTVIEKQKETVSAWEERKKGVMQKLFSQEVRFKADDGSEFPDWEEKKLGECGRFYTGVGFSEKYQGHKGLDVDVYKVSDMNIVGNEKYMTLSNNTVDDSIVRQMKTKVITSKCLVFAKVGAAIYGERKRITTKPFLIDNNMMAFEPYSCLNIEYLHSWSCSVKFSQYAQVGALPSYNSSDIGIIKIHIPCLAEQQKIADCLSSLDEVIEKQKATLAAWEELKKGLLQQMFV